MGSVDPGPYYLGAGKLATARRSIEARPVAAVIGAVRHGIPLIIGTAGTGGGDPHLDRDASRSSARSRARTASTSASPRSAPRCRATSSRRPCAPARTVPIGPIAPLTEADDRRRRAHRRPDGHGSASSAPSTSNPTSSSPVAPATRRSTRRCRSASAFPSAPRCRWPRSSSARRSAARAAGATPCSARSKATASSSKA